MPENGAQMARQAASALYHRCSAITMAWEGARGGSAQRIEWAQLVLLHRVLPRHPLAPVGVPAGWPPGAPTV